MRMKLNVIQTTQQQLSFDTIETIENRLGYELPENYKFESFWKDNKYRSYLEEFRSDFQIPRDYLESEYLYLIAKCDNQAICMALNGIHKGKIYSADNGDFGIVFQTNSLAEFLESLYDQR